MTAPPLPPDLARLRVLETWLTLQLDAVRAARAAAEQPTAWREHNRNWRQPGGNWADKTKRPPTP